MNVGPKLFVQLKTALVDCHCGTQQYRDLWQARGIDHVAAIEFRHAGIFRIGDNNQHQGELFCLDRSGQTLLVDKRFQSLLQMWIAGLV